MVLALSYRSTITTRKEVNRMERSDSSPPAATLTPKAHFGAYLSSLRRERRLSIKTLAERLQVHPNHLYRIQRGWSTSFRVLASLPEALNLAHDESEHLYSLARKAGMHAPLPQENKCPEAAADEEAQDRNAPEGGWRILIRCRPDSGQKIIHLALTLGAEVNAVPASKYAEDDGSKYLSENVMNASTIRVENP